MKFLLWFRRTLSIICFLAAIAFVVAMFFVKNLNFLMWLVVIIFLAGIFIWPNQTTYCKICGNKYDIDDVKLLKTYKSVKENKNYKKTRVFYNVGHKCHCSKCNRDFAYTEDINAGRIVVDKNKGITTDMVRPFDEFYSKDKKNK